MGGVETAWFKPSGSARGVCGNTKSARHPKGQRAQVQGGNTQDREARRMSRRALRRSVVLASQKQVRPSREGMTGPIEFREEDAQDGRRLVDRAMRKVVPANRRRIRLS